MPKHNQGRTRELHAEFFTDEKLGQCSLNAGRLFLGLITLADREGRLEEPHPVFCRMKFFAAWDVDCAPLIEEIVKVGLIRRFNVDGRALLWLPGFRKRNRVHPRERESILPAHPEDPSPRGTYRKREKKKKGAPRRALGTPRFEKGGEFPSGSSGPSGPSGSSGPIGTDREPPPPNPPPPSNAARPTLVVVGKKKALLDDLTPAQRETWEFIQTGRRRARGLPDESTPPPDFPDWSDRLDEERIAQAQVDHALALYLRDEHFADRCWPTAVFITDGVFRSRLPAQREATS